jgi:hypothetical protein
VVVAFFLIPFEAQRHGWILLCSEGRLSVRLGAPASGRSYRA